MPKGNFRTWCCQCPHPCGEPLLTHTSTEDPLTRAGSFRSIAYRVIAPFLWILVHTRFCLRPPRLSLCFPQSCGCPVSNPAGLQGQIPWVFPVPLSDPPAGKPDVWFRTFMKVEFLWYYSSSVCGSPTRRVWDLILFDFRPSYHLTSASSLALDIGYLFLVGSRILLSMVIQ